MIWQSWYWRADLQKFAASLRRRAVQKRWPDASLARCEQTIMVGFFYVRKLIESRKLTRDFAERPIRGTSYPTKGSHVHLMNRTRDPGELFQMDTPCKVNMEIEDLANQIIHSYVFWLSFDGQGSLDAILVASDRTRNNGLLEISVRDVAKIFDLAAMGENAITMRYDDRRQDWAVRRAKSEKKLK